MPWKVKVTETKTEVSNEYQIRLRKLLDNLLRQDQDLDQVLETNPKAAVRGLILRILPSSLTHLIQELPVPENELANISATKECTSVESEDQDMGTNSKAAVRGLIHIVEIPAFSDAYLNPEIVRNPPGGYSHNITVYPVHRERGLKGVAVCSNFHTSPIDTRGSWSSAKNY